MSEPPSGRKKWLLAALFLVLAAAAVITVVLYLDYRSTHVDTDDAFIDGPVYEVAARDPGQVTEVLVADDESVAQGAVLIRLDPLPALAALHIAQANLDLARNQITARSAQLDAARAEAQKQASELDLARLSRDRATALFKNAGITRDELDRAQTTYDTARSAWVAAEQQVRQLEATLGPGPTTRVAEVRIAEAKLDAAELTVDHTVLRAPHAGWVTKKDVEVGHIVSEGQRLLSIVPLGELWITANYKETQLAHLRVGQHVDIDLDTYGITLDGRVASIMAGTGSAFALLPPENATGNWVKVVQRVPVRIVLRAPPPPAVVLRLGMSVHPTVLVDE